MISNLWNPRINLELVAQIMLVFRQNHDLPIFGSPSKNEKVHKRQKFEWMIVLTFKYQRVIKQTPLVCLTTVLNSKASAQGGLNYLNPSSRSTYEGFNPSNPSFSRPAYKGFSPINPSSKSTYDGYSPLNPSSRPAYEGFNP